MIHIYFYYIIILLTMDKFGAPVIARIHCNGQWIIPACAPPSVNTTEKTTESACSAVDRVGPKRVREPPPQRRVGLPTRGGR